MDAGWFLKERTKFIRHFYDEAARPFQITMLSIENRVAPFIPPPFDPECDPAEPAFLTEWMDASIAVDLLGRSCVSILSESLKSYFETLQYRVIGFSLAGSKQGIEGMFRKEGFVPVYKRVLGEIMQTDWSDCPASFDIIEQTVLARNRSNHGASLTSLHVHHDAKTLEKYPRPFFASAQEVEAWDGEAGWPDFLAPNLMIDRDTLFQAIEHVEMLSDWIESNSERYVEWRMGSIPTLF
jgi:hypothetical protein